MSVDSPQSVLPQRTLDLLILKTIALGPVHGYAIAQPLQQISPDVIQVPGGSLYPALHRLENRKLIAAKWRGNGDWTGGQILSPGAPRQEELQANSRRWQRLSDAVDLILGMPEGGTP